MSFYAKVKTSITDLNTFKKMCTKHDITINEVSTYDAYAYLQDKHSDSRWRLMQDAKNANRYHLHVDNDTKYCRLSRRLGKNGGMLMRDYTQEVVKKKLRASGGIVQSTQTLEDGSIVLKVSNSRW